MKKKTQLLLACIAVLGIGLIIINACSKTENEGVTQKGVITHFSPSQDMVVPTITKFIQRFDNFKAGYKTGGEDIKLGEAIWTLEAGVNYAFQSPKEDLCNFSSAETNFIVDVYVGEDNEYYLAEEDAMNLFSNMLNFTTNQLSGEEVDLFVADLEIETVENGQAAMKFDAKSGLYDYFEKSGSDPFLDCDINSTDYWYAAADAGKCGDYEDQYDGKDAANRISVLLDCVQLSVGYWTDVYNTGNIVSHEDNNNDPCFWGMDYTGDWDECLDPTDMDYWWGQAEYVIEDLEPTGKTYIDSRFDDDLLTDSGWFHYFENIRYGIPHQGGIGK